MKIKMVENGFLVTTLEEVEQNQYREREYVFGVDDDQADDSEFNVGITRDLINFVLLYFNLQGSKHDEHRISVDVEKLK